MSLDIAYPAFKSLLLALLMPPAPFLMLAAWGGWRLHRRRRGGGWMLSLALLGVWLSATEAAGELLSRAAGQPAPLRPGAVMALRGATDGAVLVLGGGVHAYTPEYGGGSLRHATAERLSYGVWVARRSGWPLAFSGGIGWTATALRRPESHVVARVAAQDYALPLRWSEGASRDTRENAARMLPVLQQAGVRRVVLVTHAEHMRRALRAFEGVAAPLGVEVLPAPVGLRPDALGSFDDWCPSATGFARVRYVVYETLAWWAGR